MPRNARNLSGEVMESGTSPTMRLVLRRVRRYCLRHGALLNRFRQVYGYETHCGPEWHATARHWSDAVVLVHLCMGSEKEDAVQVAHAHLSGRTKFGGVWVVNFVGPADFIRSMTR